MYVVLCSHLLDQLQRTRSAIEGHQSHKHIHTRHHALTHSYCMGMKACVFEQKRMVKWAGEEAGQG